MRKLKLQVQMSVDGYIAGKNGEMDWMVWNWDDKIKQYVTEITEPVDCIILGRKLAQGFIPHWANAAANPNDPEFPFAKKMADTHKVLFTTTLEKSEWANTVLAKGDLTAEVNKLKSQNGGDVIVYGGGEFVSSLIKAGLIDEFHLFVNPAALGDGMAIFSGLENRQDFALKKSIAFECGIVVLCYEKR